MIHFEPGGRFARTPLREARRSLQALQLEPLEGSRLPDAIVEMARRWSETSSVAMSFGTTGRPVPLLTELEVALFRVAQEALANVARHSSASRVDLTISHTDDLCCSTCGTTVSALPGAGTGLSASVQAIAMAGRRMSASGAIRLLIVDDHPVVRDGLRGIFAVEAGSRSWASPGGGGHQGQGAAARRRADGPAHAVKDAPRDELVLAMRAAFR